MMPILYEDDTGAYDALDICDLISDHKALQSNIKALAEKWKEGKGEPSFTGMANPVALAATIKRNHCADELLALLPTSQA